MDLQDFTPKIISAFQHYHKQQLYADLMAGLMVGIVSLPLSIAFGIASGVTPEMGILTAIIAGLIITILGGSRVQVGGPTGAYIVIVYGIVQEYGIMGVAISTMMAGAILILLGLFRLGTLIKYIPQHIIAGFTCGLAIAIFTSQVVDILGLDFGGGKLPNRFADKWLLYLAHLHTINWWHVSVSTVSVAVLVVAPKVLRRVPSSLVAIVMVTLCVAMLQVVWGVSAIDTIGNRFTIVSKLPDMVLPTWDWGEVQELWSVALTIALIGAIESLLSARVADAAIGDRHHSSAELLAQGVANIIAPLFGGIPATGSVARTMTSVNNGGRTPIAGVVHSVVLLLILLYLMPLAAFVPMACLATVLTVVAYHMMGLPKFVQLLRTDRPKAAVFVVVCVLTILYDPTIAIGVGLLLTYLIHLFCRAHRAALK